MDYKEARVVIFPLQFGVEISPNTERSHAWAMISMLALNRTKLHNQGEDTHLKQHGLERELILLPYFPGYYESIMGEGLAWKDPIQCFVQDLDIMLQNTDAVIWIYATPKDATVLMTLLSMVTHEIHMFNGLLEESKVVVMDFPNVITV